MGQYNPHAPYIIGQEWVPIRNAHYVPDGVTERGYTFTLNAITVPVSGAYYVEEPPLNRVDNACDFISVYPAGRETLTGPIKMVTIPVSAVNVVNPGGIDATDGVAALQSNQDNLSVIFFGDSGVLSLLDVSFDTNAYAQVLLGKRIVDLRLRYSFVSHDVTNSERVQLRIVNPSSFDPIIYPQPLEMTLEDSPNTRSTISLGELTPAWNSAVPFDHQRTVLPWRFQELNRFRSGAAAGEALVVEISNAADNTGCFLEYLALEVLYCEETRVLYGGFRVTPEGPLDLPEIYKFGAIATQLYNPVTHTPGATLPAGAYTVTIYHRDLAIDSSEQGSPRLHALREYYGLVDQRNVRIKQTTIVDDQFTMEDNASVLPQITLHTASQIVTGSHPYGTQYGAPVYGVRTVVQEIEDNPGSSASYPQVRFYARRYGFTTVPLTLVDVAAGVSTVSISVSDFDALPEIVDGWREVTLRFTTAPTFTPSADDVDWRWQATTEKAGNQWQIMVADGPTGAWQPNPTAAATGPATYWSPFGSQVALTWQSPSISGVAQDTTSDAVLIFSQDPPTVTGFAVELAEQQLSPALGCHGQVPRCVPSAIDYHEVTWDPFGHDDNFDREAVDGWGSPNGSTLTYTMSGGSPSDYQVTDGVGYAIHHTSGIARISQIGPTLVDAEAYGVFSIDQTPTGANFEVTQRLRLVDAVNFVDIRINLTTSNAVGYSIRQVVAAVATTTAFAGTLDFSARARVAYRLQAVGSTLRARVWDADGPEPGWWQTTMTVTHLTGGEAQLNTSVFGGSTNPLPVTFTIYHYSVTSAGLADGSLEVQRRDSITDWQIVVKGSPGTSLFRDYEARVGDLSEYRIRTLNVLDFEGPWVSGSGTIPTPGVTVGGFGNSVLIFTSNEQPDSNLAYVMQFEGQSIEQFSFPEADTVSLQRLFGRDFFLAIRPLERGGERFSRVLLVNQAAITIPSLANFRDLRDLAWADLSYVCVRDELGNRWFATVIVPEGSARGDRTIYMARVDVAEVTGTSSQVDPTA